MKQKEFKSLKEAIINNKVHEASKDTALFGGADISIVSKKSIEPDSFYSEPQYVITRYSKELSWLFFELKGIFKDNLDYINKYPFYGKLAEKANQSIELHGDNLNQILLDVVEEAEKLSRELM